MTSSVAELDLHQHAGKALPWPDARLLAHRLPAPLCAVQLPLAAAAGRTLALPVRAAVMQPGFDNAAMDGFAVRGAGPWHLVGRTLAGHAGPAALAPGEAVEIATGAVVPEQTDRVVEYEVAVRDGDLVYATPSHRRHIRRAGEYVQVGQEVLPAGSVLTAPAMGLAASVGLDTVTVRKRPVVRLLVTGDEVVTVGVPPYGKVRDAIGPVIKTLLQAWGAELAETRWVPDHPRDALTVAIADSLSDADVTVVCGSSSVGPADGLHDTLGGLGANIHIDGVDCRPGHPQVLAEAGSRWLAGLPGNPFAALVAAFTVLQPLLSGLAGRSLPALPRAPLSGDLKPECRRTRIVPVRWQQREAHVINGAHPGHLGAAARADALAVVPPTWQPDQTVDILLMPV